MLRLFGFPGMSSHRLCRNKYISYLFCICRLGICGVYSKIHKLKPHLPVGISYTTRVIYLNIPDNSFANFQKVTYTDSEDKFVGNQSVLLFLFVT